MTTILDPSLRQKMEKLLQKYKVPGLCVSVVRKQDEQWAEEVLPFGTRDGSGSPWKEDSMHAIASCSKVFAAASVGLLIDRKTTLPNGQLLTWRTRIKDVLPEWKVMDEVTEANADIEDVLAMRLGIPGHNGAWGGPNDTQQAMIARMQHYKPSTALRKTATYSNDSFAVAGEFIARLTGTPYHVFVKENIFDPLGITSTTFNYREALDTGRRVEGFVHYDRDGKAGSDAVKSGGWSDEGVGEVGQVKGWDIGDGMFFAAAGGILSTGADIIHWLKETLDPHILSRDTLDELNRPRTSWGDTSTPHPTLSHNTYGIGQWTWYYRGHRIVGHSGDIPGHYSMVFRLPDDAIGLAVFCNDETFGGEMVKTVFMMVIDEMLGLGGMVDWEDVYLLKKLREAGEGEKVSESYRSNTTDISGTYHHPAYGNLIVKRIEDHPMGPTFSRLLAEYPGHSIPLRPNEQIYLGDLPQKWIGKLLLSISDANLFTRAWIRADEIVRPGEADMRYAGVVNGIGKCMILDKGIGMPWDFCGASGEGADVSEWAEEDAEHAAALWFEKIST